MAKRCIVPPQVDLHKHRCEFCQSVTVCPGVACRKIKHRTCYTCSSPERVKQRAEQKRLDILRERESGLQLSIFVPGALGAYTVPAWFQGDSFSYTAASGTYPLLSMPMPKILWDAGGEWISYKILYKIQSGKPDGQPVLAPALAPALDPEFDSDEGI
jgi:hypothetical protein